MSEIKKHKPKADAVEYERRLMSIQLWIVERHSYTIIIKQIMDKGWSKSERHAKRMIATARDRWIDQEEEDIKKKKHIKVKQLEHTIRSLKEEYKGTPEGISAIVKVEKEIIKLEGLATPIKIEHTGNDGAPIQVENLSNIDYTKLSSEVLRQIANARIKTVI